MKHKAWGAAAALGIALAGVRHVGRGAHASGDPITLKFQSLAFQDSTIAATEAIVDAWNAANPDVQVEILQGSWDNVHDQLITQFAGGTAPDIIHYESAAHRRVRPAGLPRRPVAVPERRREGERVRRHLGHGVHRRRGDHRRADAAAVLRRVRQHRRCSTPPASRCRPATR